MKRIGTSLAMTLLLASSAVARVAWNAAEDSSEVLVRNARQAYLLSVDGPDPEVVDRLHAVWSKAEHLRSVVASRRPHQNRLPDAIAQTGTAIREAQLGVRYADPAVGTHFARVEQAFLRLKQALQFGRGLEQPAQLGATVDIERWRGRPWNRRAVLSGELRGVDLTRADLLVTDEEGRVVWSKRDALPQIDASYRSGAARPGEVAEIPFRIELPVSLIPPDASYVYVRVNDRLGRTEDAGVELRG